MKYCYHCKRAIDGIARFCPYCGTALGENDPNVGAPENDPSVNYHAYSSMTLGILSLVCYCLGATIIVVPILAILGIVFACISRPKGARMSGFARMGFAFSVISLVLFILLVLVVLIVVIVVLHFDPVHKMPPEAYEPYVQWIVQKDIPFSR